MKPDIPAFVVAAVTDVGKKRKNNEDSFGLFTADGAVVLGPTHSATVPCERRLLAVVSDGMGGAQAGEVASRMGVELLGKWFATAGAQIEAEALRSTVVATDQAVFRAAQKRPDLAGMGATLSTLWLIGDRFAFAHVGDSRIYRWRDEKLEQLTNDQTVLARMIRDGEITPDSPIAGRYRSVLEQVLGSEPGLLKPQIIEGEVCGGDVFLLCSDGLYDGLDAEAIAACLRGRLGGTPLGMLGSALVEAAKEASGRDNITVVLVWLLAAGRADPENPAPGAPWWNKLTAWPIR